MIAGIKIVNYKAIQATPRIEISNFHVLVGPNGSGKSTFLDAIEFIKSCLVHGPAAAVEQRVPDFRDLTYMRHGGPIQLEISLNLPDPAPDRADNLLKYKLEIAADAKLGVRVADESLVRIHREDSGSERVTKLLGKTKTGGDVYKREVGRYMDSFQFGPTKLSLSLTPPDLQRYPTANAVKSFFAEGVRYIQLNSVAMRQPAQATRPTTLDLDGTNLARVVGQLQKSRKGAAAIDRWISHLRYALDDLEGIHWASRQPDNAEYLELIFKGGLKCPAWLLSDGTLRMLALTLPAFIPGAEGLYMVEEPENGIHPHALEITLRALQAIPSAQVLVATHSPLVVQQVGVSSLLCFTRREGSGVSITSGSAHPALKNWSGSPDLATIFASRVLG